MPDWLKGLFKSPTKVPGTGALLISAEERLNAVHFGEIVASAEATTWVTKLAGVWRRFPVFDQNGCSACVAFTMAKLLGIMRWLKDGVFVEFSPGHIYIRRTNAGEGMNSVDPYAAAAEGVTLDSIVPSQELTEAQINAINIPGYAKEVASLFALSDPKPITLPTGDIESIASVIQRTGKGVQLFMFFTAAEWGIANGVSEDYNIPQILTPGLSLYDAAALHHSVAAVDFTLYNGKKALIIEDSAHFNNYRRHILTEDFLAARNYFAGYPMNLKTVQAVPVEPGAAYTFRQPLLYIPWDNDLNQPSMPSVNAQQLNDVKALQHLLQSLKDSKGDVFFPTNVQPTGYYGNLTAQAILNWQLDRRVASAAELLSLKGQRFGPASIAQANKEQSI